MVSVESMQTRRPQGQEVVVVIITQKNGNRQHRVSTKDATGGCTDAAREAFMSVLYIVQESGVPIMVQLGRRRYRLHRRATGAPDVAEQAATGS